MNLVRIHSRPGYFGVNDDSGTRIFTTRGLLSVRAMLRDTYGKLEVPALRGDMDPLSAAEHAELIVPLHTDRYGCLIDDL